MAASLVDAKMPLWSIVIATILCAGIAFWMGYDMVSLLFWGWRPMFLELACWGCLLFPLFNRYSRHSSNTRFLLAATLSGFLFSISFPTAPLTPLIFVSWIPLIWIEDQLSEHSKILRPWMVWKYAFHALLIWNVISTFWVVNTGLFAGLIANILNAILMAAVFMGYHIVKHFVGSKWHWITLASLWISFEYLHLFWDISWPWLTLGNTFAQHPLWIQWYELTGVFGGSLWVVALNFLIYSLISQFQHLKKLNRRKLVGTIFILVFPLLVSALLHQRSKSFISNERPVEVAVVQPNFEPHYQKFKVSEADQLNRFLVLSDSIVSEQTDYLVYPETSFQFIQLNQIDRNKVIQQLRAFVDQNPRLKLVTGISSHRIFFTEDELPLTVRRRSDGLIWDAQNSAIEIEANQSEIEVYFKSKLTPGAEFFPFKRFLPFLEPIVKDLGGSMGLTKQKERTVFTSDAGKVAPVICYESVYGEHVGSYIQKGATMIFIVTNDGWWDDTPGHKQHLAFASLRAIEHRRPIARSANTGTSAFITAEGKILQPTAYEVTTAIKGSITPRSDLTFYSRWGDYIPRLAVGLTALLITFTISAAWKKKANVRIS